jgi:hypothetical protein
MLLKDVEFGKHFRLMFQKKDPSKFGIIINEAYIVTVLAN